MGTGAVAIPHVIGKLGMWLGEWAAYHLFAVLGTIVFKV